MTGLAPTCADLTTFKDFLDWLKYVIQCPKPWSLEPGVTIGFSIVEFQGKQGFQMSKDSDAESKSLERLVINFSV
jgi:hypothetical protein